MAITARSSSAFHGCHRRFSRLPADQCRQDSRGGDCRTDDSVVGVPDVDRDAAACTVRPDLAIIQKNIRTARLQRFLPLRC
ncbi:hypothetical protein JGUZn3_00990 [Entomobacter blattae]|uniref:Uncharacterized protein n=1 Tax=Entomobacter blattae TaxID=2762277 RepID=A0A7H1NNK6_9PROT|nr:hypothetical protein JGUZn3_00990 [Entomobacter blattae]